MLKISSSTKFAKDVQLAKKRGKNASLLTEIMERLANGEKLELKYRAHKLKGEFAGSWECHIEPDWLLIYTISATEVRFERTGTHSDLFRS